MHVSLMSDLHLEVADSPVLPGGDLLLLAGDILTSRPLRPKSTLVDKHYRMLRARYESFAETQLSKYTRVLMVRGNHEPWSDQFEDCSGRIRDFLQAHAPHARLLDNEVEELRLGDETIAVLGTTLWAPCGAGGPDEYRIRDDMRDFARITYNGNRFEPRDALAEHQKALAFLAEAVPQHSRVIVMSHHAPTLASSSSHLYRPDLAYLEEAYCSDQSKFILDHPQIERVVHGHTHYNVDYMCGTTRIVTNQRGYFGLEESAKYFDPAAKDFTIEPRSLPDDKRDPVD